MTEGPELGKAVGYVLTTALERALAEMAKQRDRADHNASAVNANADMIVELREQVKILTAERDEERELGDAALRQVQALMVERDAARSERDELQGKYDRLRKAAYRVLEVDDDLCASDQFDAFDEVLADLGDVLSQRLLYEDDEPVEKIVDAFFNSGETPTPTVGPEDDRDPECVKAWPGCHVGGYDPRCCRFPKSCSCWR